MLVNNILDASNKEDDIVDVDATAKKDFGIAWKGGGWKEIQEAKRNRGVCGSYGSRLNRLCADILSFVNVLPLMPSGLCPSTYS